MIYVGHVRICVCGARMGNHLAYLEVDREIYPGEPNGVRVQ